jgi:hypothetical protein
MRKLAATLGITAAIALAATTAAAANTVTRTTFVAQQNELFGEATSFCGFFVGLNLTGTVAITTFLDDDGELVKEIITTNLDLTAFANDKQLAGKATGTDIFTFVDGQLASDQENGIAWNFIIPGSGTVLQFIGHYDLVTGRFSGMRTGAADSAAFCNYFADP